MAEPIIIVPYNPDWPAQFTARAGLLRAALGAVAMRIDHIGSTAVPGLAAKPVIDIQIAVAALEPNDPFRICLEKLGYVFHADNPDLTKRYFREPPGQARTHIHVRREGSWSEQFALLFRDYLRTHPESAAHYAQVKCRLAEQYRDDREAYTNAKGPVIWEIMVHANEWCQEMGWESGPNEA
jgi:GrpB-like predicted nucleotidyltransferase (UPF0157 family)